MATRNNEPPSQVVGDGGNSTPPAGQKADQAATTRAGNKVLKSGPLFLSSKGIGIGWTSWKKRWFILTRTSLVFFRSDPNAVAQKGSEVNLTLGGIDLNNSGSVVVKADKKLLTVLFPDGRDGRTFSLKAETMEDLYEWKNALDAALAQAPSATLVMGQNGMLGNEQTAAADGSTAQLKDKQNMKSMVIGRPVLLALEEVDGTPSFLEKALRFVEEHGAKTEGVLRQAADVDDVEYRIREYENGKNEFSPNEDAHVIGDCIKYVLRELPSSPVPASCCNALLEACKSDRERRINAMRTAICETFPEPNRRLLQRILIMMQKVAAHKAVNRMSPSAVAACMAPLLLRPLLSGECELEHDFDVGGDGSAQLLQAAAAANHAQSIVMTLLEEYDHIFGEGSLSPDIYSDSEESGSEGEEVTDDEYYEEDDEEEYEDEEDEEYEDEEESGIGTDDESENLSGESRSVYDDDDDEGTVHTRKEYDVSSSGSGSESPEVVDLQGGKVEPVMEDVKTKMIEKQRAINSQDSNNKSAELGQVQNSAARSSSTSTSTMQKSSTISSGAAALRTNEGVGTDSPTDVREKQKPSGGNILTATMNKSTSIAAGILNSGRRQVWGRTPAKKNPSMESIGSISEEDEIQKLEASKADLENKIAEEAKENEILLANLECKKKSVFERRKALEQDVAKLQLQLQKERDLRRALEAGLKEPHKPLPFSPTIDGKVKADLEELAAAEANINNLKKMVDDLGNQLNKQREENKSVSQQSSSKHTKVTSNDNESKNAHPDENPRKIKDSLDKNQTDGVRNQESTSSSMNKSQAPSRKLDSVQSKKHQLPKRQLDSLSSKKHQPLSHQQQQQQDSTVSNKEEHQLPKRQLDSLSSKKHQPLSHQQQDSTVSNKEEHPSQQLESVGTSKQQQQQPQNQNLDSVGSSKSKPGGQMSNPQGSDSGTVRDSAPVSSKEYDKHTEKQRMPDEFQSSSMEKGQQGLSQGVMSPGKSRGAESAQKPATLSSVDMVREGDAVPSYPDNNKKPKSDDLNRARASEGQSSSQDVNRKKK